MVPYKTWKLEKEQQVFYFIRRWIIPVFMEGKIVVPFPAVNAQTQGKISSILKIISVGKCELYSEKYSYQ
jgi:hypothetical protein